MVKATYPVSPAVVDWVISQLGTHTTPVDSLPLLKEWQAGVKTPTLSEIETVSKKTHIPLGYFFLQTPPKEEIKLMEFRTIASTSSENPSRDLIDTIEDMEQIVDWTRDYLIADGSGVNPIVGKLKHETNVGVIANYIRQVLGLSTNWFETKEPSFNYLRDRMSEAGIIVMMNGVVRNNTHRPLNIDEFRAFAIADTFAPLIFINATDSKSGRLFSLLHEFVHICLGVDDLFNDRHSTVKGVSKLEILCNAVAAEILVPTNLFYSTWESFISRSSSTEETIHKVSHFFKCGNIVVARKALDTGKISHVTYDNIVQNALKHYIENRKSKDSGGNFYNTKGSRIDKRFLTFVVDSVSRGTTLYSEAFRLTDTNRHTFPKLVERMND
ncbi:ImmA/IrrE family metallo-endopeptidase [Sphaerochaeta halotolerans]|jgi:Zn-dependent peptidase ImmA (M78 family)|uniref:ImmA/IrrE family metallo-endopeptidase n=1 Tax=Sphaerochaeta halotolerans TaxID=2293840 RepID=A0A372MEJ9_9SPIR|nr:ImmA/IrrE family metallo-endopeptidase [Sphaerochaeta halotolerans]MXI87000.1 ImmA/IrrE family metallo-endopeptidase [Sphaerochaeta halotolerans]RFU93716.1 ImmA/IrrE family metallo-endopeptidase [Sphaerochaeta halotolerans]